jgi:hypothetical protein
VQRRRQGGLGEPRRKSRMKEAKERMRIRRRRRGEVEDGVGE